MNGTKLTEAVTFDGCKFEESDGVRTIKNVAFLGAISKNGYKYRKEAMQRAVSEGLYSNTRIFINHPTKEEERTGRRDTMKLAGQTINARFEDGKVKGDIKLLDDAQGLKFWSIAKTAPGIASCSHVADGKLVSAGREKFVEEINRVLSVDLVVQGATTNSVFENLNERTSIMDDYAKIDMKELRIRRPDIIEALAKEGAESRNADFSALQEENKSLKVKVDEFQVKEAAAAKAAEVDELLKESKLPEAAKTDVFRDQLVAIEGENWKETAKSLIEDRRAISGGVKNMGTEKRPGSGGNTLSLKEARDRLVG